MVKTGVFNSGAKGTSIFACAPSKFAAVLVSPVRPPGTPKVTLLKIVPFPAASSEPELTALVEPAGSPSRQYPTG
jgi:hypothetical protein